MARATEPGEIVSPATPVWAAVAAWGLASTCACTLVDLNVLYPGPDASQADASLGTTTHDGAMSSDVESSDSPAPDAVGTPDDDADSGGLSDAAINAVPASYEGRPFAVPAGHSMTIPGSIYLADYDNGGASIVYCHTNQAAPTPSVCGGFNTTDWLPANTPIYRPVPVGDRSGTCNGAACDDNAGLCHMNTTQPDHDSMGNPIMPEDVYVCYVAVGEWLKYTVQVDDPGTYSVSGLMGAPSPPQNPAPLISLDFGVVAGTDVTTGVFKVPSSVCNQPDGGCPDGYHIWQMDNDMTRVTFPAPGTYVMTLTFVESYLNPDYFTFTKL